MSPSKFWMESDITPLLPLFESERAASRAVVLGILAHTSGSTYRKAGALVLIADDGRYSGLLSGGCLEGDLRDRARAVMETGEACLVNYDHRDPDESLWGLGLGCEGAMSILLLRVGPQELWQPMAHLAAALSAYTRTAIGVVTESDDSAIRRGVLLLPEGSQARILPLAASASAQTALLDPRVLVALSDAKEASTVQWVQGERGSWKLLLLPFTLPPKILLLGAGPDARPVVELASRLYWRVSLVDHRPAYADPEHFPLAERVVLARPDELAHVLDIQQFSAAVVMSHHLLTDIEYLRVLSDSRIKYIGLLGPRARRERALAGLGPRAELLLSRLRAPVGLNLGGRTPEAIALAVVAEIQAFMHGTPLSGARYAP